MQPIKLGGENGVMLKRDLKFSGLFILFSFGLLVRVEHAVQQLSEKGCIRCKFLRPCISENVSLLPSYLLNSLLEYGMLVWK